MSNVKPTNCDGCDYTTVCQIKKFGVSPKHAPRLLDEGKCRCRAQKAPTHQVTCFGCTFECICFLSAVTGLFTVRFPTGDANCINYDLFSPKEGAPNGPAS